WIETDPSLAGNVSLGPCVGGPFAAHSVFVGAYVSADIACGHVAKAQHEKQDMGEVLAYTGFQLPYFVGGAFDRGYSFLIFEIAVDVRCEINCHFKWSFHLVPFPSDHFF